MKTREQILRYQATAKAKRHAKAIAEGRIPGQTGTPIRSKLTPEQKSERHRLKMARRMADPDKRAKHYAAKNEARRIKRLAEGVKPRRKFSSKEEKLASLKSAMERFREKHRERLRKYQAEWKQKLRSTPEGREYLRQLAIVNGAKRRAQKKGCNGTHTLADIKQLWFLQGGKCAWCEQALGDEKTHVDHWIPLSKGGSNNKDNLRLLHKKCNLRKSDKLPPELKLTGTHN